MPLKPERNLKEMKTPFKTHEYETDLCVVGGGLSGICAAIAAARRGIKVMLMQDRPMFGGNASSEVRMWVCSAHGDNNRETGLIEEMMLENFYRNPYANYTIWDSIMYEKVRFQDGLEYLLNCSCLDAEMQGDHIISITGWQTTTQTYHTIRAKQFIDSSGDSILAPLTGAAYRVGREARSEFGEDIAPEQPDKKTMGMSCLVQAREHHDKRTYQAPFWAEPFNREKLPYRKPNPRNRSENYWYLELGGEQDSIADTEMIRDQLQDAAYGIWDYIKNSGEFGSAADNLDLDWIGILPGKRESRRYVGDYIMNQNDVRTEGRFDDLIAYGGWTMDDHHPGGLRAAEPPTIFHPAPSPFGIPYRCLYSQNIANLMFAGRNISVTHTAMSATRVMGTCATLGQAAGTAAALAVQSQVSPREIGQMQIRRLQDLLMDDDCYLPFHKRTVSRLTSEASITSDQPGADNLRNGKDRTIGSEPNCWEGQPGSHVTYEFTAASQISRIRLVFDSDLNRETLTENGPDQYRPMKSNYFLDDKAMRVPATLIKDFTIEYRGQDGSWQQLADIRGNHQRLVILPTDIKTAAVRLKPHQTWGADTCRIFAFEVS